MGEIIFNKSQKNLKKIYNRLKSKNLNQYVKANDDKILFLAIGGYNRTYELIRVMGVNKEDIATFSNLSLTQNFILETHNKKVLYINKINYTTSVNKNSNFTIKKLDLNVADAFEESLLIYKTAQRIVRVPKKENEDWNKPSVVILDDPSLNLQYEGHRFRFAEEIGFVQMRNRNANPQLIIDELEEVEEADKMMFALYQLNVAQESEVNSALDRIRQAAQRKIDDDWAFKPSEFKKLVGSKDLAENMKAMQELKIKQLKSNKKIGKENACWVIIPESAFLFKGFDYKDEADLFEEELRMEESQEEMRARKKEAQLESILAIQLPFNIRTGYTSRKLSNTTSTLQEFINDIDDIETEKINGIELLNGATTEEEYKHIKKYNLAYFIDGNYEDNERADDNYQGGKRLISIDIDDADYTLQELETKLESQALFGVIYRTAKYYYNQSNRWRIILMADSEMDKEQYRNTITGIAKMLDLEIDEASKKLSQLMGYPLSSNDTHIVMGTTVNVSQFKTKEKSFRPSKNVIGINSGKPLIDFNHSQAKLIKQALQGGGIGEGSRNESYFQMNRYLLETINNQELEAYHNEAYELLDQIKVQAQVDGLDSKEMELVFREL